MEDGLSNNSVQCLLQDKKGILWIGTNGGLNRYDGSGFLLYSVLSKPALVNNVVTALMQDKEGLLWIGTENGLNILDPVSNSIRAFVHQDHDPGSLPAGAVRSIQTMSDGSIWLLSDTWLAKYTSHGFVRIGVDPALTSPTKVFTRLTEGGDGSWWLSYLDQPTAQVKHNSDSLYSTGIFWPDYANVYTDRRRTVWGISYQGLSRRTTAGGFETWLKNPFADPIPDLHLYTCFTADADGNIWQGSRHLNLVKYDMQHHTATNYSWLLYDGNATMVYCFYTDNSNNLWIGTDNGILKLSSRSSLFKSITCVLHGVEQKDIRCRKIVETKDGILYAGTESHGLLKLTPNATGDYTTQQLSAYGAFPVSSLPFRDNTVSVPMNGHYDIGFIYDIWDDHRSTLWLTGYGLGRYDTRSASLNLYLADGDEATRRESITLFVLCPDDRQLWLGGLYNLFLFDTVTRRMHAFTDLNGNAPFHDLPCWSLVKQGKWIWAGTDRGLYKIDRLTREVHKDTTFPVLGLGINAIHIDKDSSLWISTAGGGVLHYDASRKQLRQYTSTDGLSNNTVCGILPDSDDNLWISTYAGLSFLDRKTDQFTVFHAKDGLPMNEFNRKAFTRLADGQLVFGGLNGYMQFDPREIFTVTKPVSLLLTRFDKTTANGTNVEHVFGVDTCRAIVIEPGDLFFSLSYTLTNLYEPAGNRYFYMLEGLDKDWHYIGNQHTLFFHSLPTGSYTLRIKGAPSKGLAAAGQLTIGITVKQVFYKSLWFIVLVVLSVAALVYVILRYRWRQWMKLQQLRIRIASDLHDEVGSNMVRIALLADSGRIGGNVREKLEAIADISRNTISSIKDVIWSIDARRDTMADTLDHMHEHVQQMLTPAEIEYRFRHTGLRQDEKLRMVFRQNVYLIFKEAINNIVKHAGASVVEMEIKRDEDLFIMRIKDNGRGMSGEGRSSGQGLHNMRMRAERVRGRLEVLSQEQGVTISLSVPV